MHVDTTWKLRDMISFYASTVEASPRGQDAGFPSSSPQLIVPRVDASRGAALLNLR